MKPKKANIASYSKPEMYRDIKQMTNLWRILLNDTQRAFSELERDKGDNDMARYRERTFVRTFFAMVEGTCYGMRYLCLRAMRIPDTVKLDPGIIEKLEEKDGKWLSLEEAVPLSFESICRVLRWPFELNTVNPGFEALMRAKQIRNKLMHPKDCSEVVLRQEDIEDVRLALKWFATEVDRWREKGFKTTTKL